MYLQQLEAEKKRYWYREWMKENKYWTKKSISERFDRPRGLTIHWEKEREADTDDLEKE